MAIDKLFLGCKSQKLSKERLRLLVAHTDDATGPAPDIERLPLSDGMASHQGMKHVRSRRDLQLGERWFFRIVYRVQCNPAVARLAAGDAGFHSRRQCIISGVKSGEVCVTAHRRHALGVEKRPGIGNFLVLTIRVPPQPDTTHPKSAITVQTVRDNEYFRVIRMAVAALSDDMERSQSAREGDVLHRGHLDITKQEDAVPQPPVANKRKGRLIKIEGRIKPDHLGADGVCQWAKRHRHSMPSDGQKNFQKIDMMQYCMSYAILHEAMICRKPKHAVLRIMVDPKARRLDIMPLGPGFCADVSGFDFHDLNKTAVAIVQRALLDYSVLRFRGYDISDEQHIAFSRLFGSVLPAPVEIGLDHENDHPELLRVSNIVDRGRKIGELGSAAANWHSDMCYKPVPPSISILHALEVPPATLGGNTQFSDMYAALAALPADLRRQLEGKVVKINSTYNAQGHLRRGVTEPASNDFRSWLGSVHPMIRTHPETERQALYLGTRNFAYVVGLPLEESEALLDTLWARIAEPRFVWTQVWQPGDLIMWDNRCVMHRRDAFDAGTRRLMHRTTLAGSVVVF